MSLYDNIVTSEKKNPLFQKSYVKKLKTNKKEYIVSPQTLYPIYMKA